MNPLLQVEHLTIFVKHEGKLIPVVKDISFHIDEGECVGIVGESGCGKSLLAQTIACLDIFPFAGRIRLNNESIEKKSEEEKRKIRATQIGIIFQNPQACLNPTMKIGEQIREVNFASTKDDVLKLLKQIGLSDADRCYRSYPHELSGGMCQRVAIAMAIIRHPKLLIADEPTTALDTTIQRQIIDLLQEIQASMQTSTLLITHDFGVVERLCQRVMVMYAGEIVEEGLAEQILHDPQHPYTIALLASRPQLGKGKNYLLHAIPGRPPQITSTVNGCPFVARCTKPLTLCAVKKPELRQIKETQQAACWNLQNGK